MKVVILAVTKMQGDRICIAGSNEENQWVRPVREYPQHMEINDIFDKNTKKPIYEVFNVVDIPVIKKIGVPPHTEDVLIDLQKNPQVVGKIPVPEREAFLIKHCENELFKGQSEPINELLEKSNRSLILVGPAKLHRAVLKIDKTPRLDFDIPGYSNIGSKPCTDMNFIALGKRILEEKKAQEVTLDSAQLANILKTDKIFLGLGLSRKFEGVFHTMVVGLYTIPDYNSEDDLKNPLNRYMMTDMYSEKTKEVGANNIGEYEKRLLDLASKAESGNFDFSHLSPQDVLRQIFGYDGFKPQQLEIITRVLNREGNTLAIMPTGGGKSLCFQIPALIRANITVVVTPLIALMKDQIDNLAKKGIYAASFINSSISENTKERILDLVKKRKIKLFYLAPESLKSERVLEVLKNVNIDLFVIDEAHCISTWGHNFRPDYLKLPEIIEELNHPQILALTATATKEVEEDIQKQLKTTCKVFRASFDRPNLYIEIIPLERNIKKESFLVNLLNRLNGQTIVFVTYQRTSEKISEILNLNGIKSVYYHAGLDREIREKIQNQFISGECKIIVATIAFGMGIDKADIRNIIHYNLPQSIESYYQEIGRAGRDGERSNCFVLFTKSDEHKLRNLISSDWPNEKKIKDIISYLKTKNAAYFFTTPRKISLDCDVKEIPTRLILHRLEEYGAIKIFTNIIYQTKPVFNKNYSKIVEDNPKYKNELEKIFSCEFFNDKRRTWLFLEEIMDKTGLNYFRILEVLNHLEKDGCLEFSETSRKDMILVKEKIKDVDITPLVNLFDSMLNHDLGKIDLLIKSITQQRCIRKNILEYFNEPKLKDTCGMCSYCVGRGLIKDIKPEINENYAGDEEIEKLIDLKIDHGKAPSSLLIIVAQYKEIPRKDFIKILIGTLHRSSSAWKFKLGCYGILDTFKDQPSILEEILEGLINKELISEEMDGTLRITKIGLTHLNSVKEKNETIIGYKKEITEDVQNCKQIKDTAAYKSEGQAIPIISEESKEQSTESPNAAFLILGLIKNLDFHAGRTLLAEILIGSKSKKLEEIRQNPKILSYYGNLRKFTGDTVTDLIDQLIAKGYLIKKQGRSNFSRPLLYLTELAEKALEERAAIDLRLPVKNAIIESRNLSLLNELKVWRKNVAFKKNIPAYCIFHNSTLIDISNIKPQNMEELKAIKGVGANKINNYGQDILNIINRCN